MWRAMLYFKQVGALLDPHLGKLAGRQVGQLVARLGDRADLELLLGLVGDLASQGDQVRQVVGGVEDGGDGHPKVSVAFDLHHRAGRPREATAVVNGQRSGPWISASASDLVEPGADDMHRRVGEREEFGIAPDDPQVGVNHRHAVGDRVEDLLGLDDHPHPAHGRKLRCVDIDAAELRVSQHRERLGDRSNRHHVERFAELADNRFSRGCVAIDDKQSRLLGHIEYPSLDERPPARHAVCKSPAARGKTIFLKILT